MHTSLPNENTDIPYWAGSKLKSQFFRVFFSCCNAESQPFNQYMFAKTYPLKINDKNDVPANTKCYRNKTTMQAWMSDPENCHCITRIMTIQVHSQRGMYISVVHITFIISFNFYQVTWNLKYLNSVIYIRFQGAYVSILFELSKGQWSTGALAVGTTEYELHHYDN